MVSKRTVMLLSLVCVFTLVFSILLTPVYGADDNGSQNYRLAGTWVINNSFGAVMTEVLSCKGDSSCREVSASFSSVMSDPTLGGLYPGAAPVQTPVVGHLHRTGPDTYEYSLLHYERNEDASVAYFWIGRGIGRIIDENTFVTSTLLYVYNGENVNLLGMDPNIGPDGMPLDETDLMFGGPVPDLAIHKRLNSVLPSLDPPADHFPLP